MTRRLIAAGLGLLALLPGCVASIVPPSHYRATVIVSFAADGSESVRAKGMADPATRRAVTADDPVRIASISKLVTALGVMRLVEAGALSLDRDVSDWLGWRMRNPAFPDVPVTLRMLLSHRSSLTDGADYIVPLGETLEQRLRDPRAWDTEHRPGSYFRYTNLNFPVVASVMEKATGERFDRLMARLVFAPLKIDACMNWTSCGSCDLSAYQPGTNGALFSPQGGVRISMRDLGKIGAMILRGGDGFLSAASIASLIGPEWRFDGTNGDTEKGFNCTYGLAVQTLSTARPGCKDDPFGDGRPRVGHAGEAYGLRSGLWLDRQRKRGIAFFTTAIPDDAPSGRSAFTTAEEAILRR